MAERAHRMRNDLLGVALRAVVYRFSSMLDRRLHMHAVAGQRISAENGQRQSGQNREYAHSRRHCHLAIVASGLGFSLSKSWGVDCNGSIPRVASAVS